MKQKCYISGKITGLKSEEYKSNFYIAECAVIVLGYIPINPLEICPYNPKYKWTDYMRIDIKALCDCDAIYIQRNWWRSKGAIVEVCLAKILKLKMIWE